MFTRLLNRLSLAAPAHAPLWPSQCIVCRAWPAQTLCGDCTVRFAPVVARCTTCALPVPPGVAICGACLRHPPPMTRCLAALPYAWPWAMCMARWKFEGDVGLTRPLARLMMEAPEMRRATAMADIVLPMPMSPQRLGERGYNPALLLARALARQRTLADLLLRTRDTPPQRGLPRARRLKNVRGAFQVNPLRASELDGRHVALIDDVMTTGASVREAASALRAAGASQISVLVLARAAN
ncbi:MAG: phosphoribosyltransferase family protein [Pseudomonadota bacterium]|nr:phosphoribosyltransferase family protein [Pseudomonadota bacterium]